MEKETVNTLVYFILLGLTMALWLVMRRENKNQGA